MSQSDMMDRMRLIEHYPVEQLRMEAPVAAILKNARVNTVGEIIKLEQAHRLLRVRNLGKKHCLAIQAALAELGIALDGTPLEPAEPASQAPAPDTQPALRTVAFVDFEHWYVALREIHNRRPNIGAWFEDLRTRGKLLDVIFFGNFSDGSGIGEQLDEIRRFTNHIVETKSTSPHKKASFTDFIMLDNIYQKVISSPDLEQIVLFTGDGDFCSVASYLRNFCDKVVGIYGIDNAISSQLEAISDWCVRLPFSNEPYEDCRTAILSNLDYAEKHTKAPTFRRTVRHVAEHYELPEDAVEAELRLMLEEGIVYTLPERSRRDYTVILNVLHVRWERLEEPN